MMIDTKQDARTLKAMRVLRGLTQAELAARAGIEPHRYVKIENGTTVPQPREWAAAWCALSSGEGTQP